MYQEFAEEIENTARTVMGEVHTALPGEIISYDAGKGIATVRPIGKFVTSDNKILTYPNIAEVPVVFPYSGIAEVGIAFPIKPKDSCIIIVSEVELDEWRSGGESEGSLRFDLTNAVVIPGLLRKGGSLFEKATAENAVVVSAGATLLTISDSGITARGDFTVEGNIYYTGEIKRSNGQ